MPRKKIVKTSHFEGEVKGFNTTMNLTVEPTAISITAHGTQLYVLYSDGKIRARNFNSGTWKDVV